MSVTIRRLTTTFIIFLLVVSGVAAYVQISNQAFINGPALAQGDYDPRKCPPYDAPLRGTIYDRNGIPLAWTVSDPNAPICPFRRIYSADAVSAGLGPVLGYFSYKYGKAGIEATFNDQLSGTGTASSVSGQLDKILHAPRYGSDLYLSIDLKLQQKANQYYDASAIYKHSAGSPCQPQGSPPGALIVENPNSGEILAMVSRPSFDPNRIDDDTYWKQINSDPNAPLLNHATQGLYVPGSTFKTVTLGATLDNGANLTQGVYSQDDATHFVPDGFDFKWVDYLNGEWQSGNFIVQFPMSLEDGYTYSDNTIYARAAVDLGKDKWLSQVARFGIAIPGRTVPPVPFDAPSEQSRAYPAITNGKPTNFDTNLLASSGFGQGDLQITPLTETEIASAVAADGKFYDPHVVDWVAPHQDNPATAQQAPKTLPPPASPDNAPSGWSYSTPQLYGDGSVFQRNDTAAKVRQAMWAVSSQGTGATVFRGGTNIAGTPIHQGGKTGTGEAGDGSVLTTWWLSLAPDDQAPGSGPAQVTSALVKEKAGEGACQVFVAEDTYEAARQLGYLKV
jgi:cell division protein FtsI/penicillin-binding protein 2